MRDRRMALLSENSGHGVFTRVFLGTGGPPNNLARELAKSCWCAGVLIWAKTRCSCLSRDARSQSSFTMAFKAPVPPTRENRQFCNTTMSAALSLREAWAAAEAKASQGFFLSVLSMCVSSSCTLQGSSRTSAWRQIRSIMRVAAAGYLPEAVSPDNMTASHPSNTALATSTHSARVGRIPTHIDSSICVAQITGFPARFAVAMSFFCAAKTFSRAMSTPRSPLATIKPSASRRISSTLSVPD
mmetsp:Transcript_72379/g.170248  ORF Transcript_72379/g.170248 Transcript_72379/m.170248 type:complete len:243 (-) Transcript_72379:414-1142(-)